MNGAELRRHTHDAQVLAERRGTHGMVEVRLRLPVDHTSAEANMLAAQLMLAGGPGGSPLRRLGASAAVSADLDRLIVSLSAPARDLERALDIVVGELRAPRLAETGTARTAVRQAALLRLARTDPGMQADEEANILVYGPHHPYGRAIDVDRLERVGPADVVEALSRAREAPGARAVAVGDADASRLADALSRAVDALGATGAPVPAVPPPRPMVAASSTIELPGESGAQLRLVAPAPPPCSALLPAMELALALLAGPTTSVLVQRLREDLGAAYGVASTIVHAQAASAVVLSITTAAVAAERVLTELTMATDTFVSVPPDPGDLARAAHQLVGARRIAVSTPAGRADRLLSAWAGSDDPVGADERRRVEIERTTGADLMEVAALHLDSRRRVLVTVRGAVGDTRAAEAPRRGVRCEDG